MLIDTHCHLDFPDFAPERDAVVARARAAGLRRMITISTQVKKFPTIAAIAETYADVYCTVGTHPLEADVEAEASVAQLVDLAAHPKCVGIGEAGLDYHYDRAPREVAQRVFRTHIAAARESGLPLVIHARDADADMAAILEEEMGQGEFKALLHCFTSSRQLAERALAIGLSISFSGVLTFKKSDELRAIARDVPLERLLVETDAPFLAPVPFRGKRNEPAFVTETAKVLAEVKGMSPADFAALTTTNALRLFSKMPPPSADAIAADFAA
ncbi:TatD family hydrolase [Methylovirgula sp. HY1]|uniref:TatD family hydrolase n=1 Tax=Methylovirgula sp. HY1 TaxID=2822761 RepID=UPI001C5B4AEC|nr:TatD family hydrolase [Methylovirgula sp. HY1]QXX73980.1 putative metal-dependent hydrolase YcfH [Methylovirgula sp. HY1]